MFTLKNLLWMVLPGLLSAILFSYWFLRSESVPLWLVGSVVVQVLLLAWWQRGRIRVILSGVKPAVVESESSERGFWLKRLTVLLFVLVLGGLGQSGWLMWKYDFPPGLALKEPLRDVGVYPLPVPEIVTIPAGEFQMGSDAYKSEQPVHAVKIADAFGMGKYEVTFDEYDYFVGEMRKAAVKPATEPEAEPVGYPFPADERWGRGSRPVINVSWHEIQGYVNWLSKRTGQQCRLPSEAEWEYAARAGKTTDYPWGDTASHEQANYGKDECCEGLAEGRDQWLNTAPVGQFPVNPFGLHDMHGNVYEWVQDCWHDNYQQAPVDGSVWETRCVDSRRVLRGGAWGNSPNGLRSAFRGWVNPGFRGYLIGFRVVCSPP